MGHANQHFVPQFYLRGFSSEPKKVHLFNIARRLSIQSAGLRNQCYRRYLYGKDATVEKQLSAIEGQVASVIRQVSHTSRLPGVGTPARDELVRFAALQILRTVKSGRRLCDMMDLTAANIERDSRGDRRLSDAIRTDLRNSLLISLSLAREYTTVLGSLRMHLILAGAGRHFITSDNPAYKYNQYCEGIEGTGINGAGCRGFQLFLPLTKRHLLMLYDHRTYKVGNSRDSDVTVGTEADMDMLNCIQAVSADENIIFSDWDDRIGVERSAAKSAGARRISGARLTEWDYADPRNRRSVLHFYEKTPDLGLQLSFLSIRRNARRLPLDHRAAQSRFRRLRGTGPVPRPTDGLSRRPEVGGKGRRPRS